MKKVIKETFLFIGIGLLLVALADALNNLNWINWFYMAGILNVLVFQGLNDKN